MRKMLIAMTKDIRVIIIKLADKLHNMQTLQYLPEQKRKNIAGECLEILRSPCRQAGYIGSKNRPRGSCSETSQAGGL